MEGLKIANFVYLMLMLISSAPADAEGISTKDTGDGVKITCVDVKRWEKDGIPLKDGNLTKELVLEYMDDNSGLYSCINGEKTFDIFVKFRTCDNCVALDIGTIVGIAVGEVVATALIGVAVFFLASQPQGKVYRQANKASDRQNLIQNQHNDSTYQPLSHGNSSEYSQLEPRHGRNH